MCFEPTADQQLRAAVRDLAGSFGDEYWAVNDAQGGFPWEFSKASADGGGPGDPNPPRGLCA